MINNLLPFYLAPIHNFIVTSKINFAFQSYHNTALDAHLRKLIHCFPGIWYFYWRSDIIVKPDKHFINIKCLLTRINYVTSFLLIFVSVGQFYDAIIIMIIKLLQVALHIPGAYNLSMHLPVVIGTVPFRRLPYLSARALQEALDYTGYLTGPHNPPPYRESGTPPPPFDGE